MNSKTYRNVQPCRYQHEGTLKASLKHLYNCPVGVVINPIAFFKQQYGVDITARVHRTTYVISPETTLLSVATTVDDSTVTFLGLILQETPFPIPNTQLLNHIVNRCKSRLHRALRSEFNTNLRYFGSDLILDGIVDHMAKGMNRYRLRFIIEAFLELRTMTFEDRPFGTGLIFFARSDYTCVGGGRAGKAFRKGSNTQPRATVGQPNVVSRGRTYAGC